ncbi:MAG TPA: hypothetical protein VJB59_04200 [Bdellovibrionota bacterium]|nr:hypothetical protein [Bdellovibrionota bacterium]
MYATFLLTVVIGLTASSTAFAERECRPVPESVVRLDAPGKPFSHIPVRNQSNLGTCYSQAAAQLVDAWRFRHAGLETPFGADQTSDFYAALLVAKDNREVCPDKISKILEMTTSERLIDGGPLCPTVNKIKQNGSCSQQKVEQWLYSAHAGPSVSYQYGIRSTPDPKAKSQITARDLLTQFYDLDYRKSYCIHQYTQKQNECRECQERQLTKIGTDFYLMTKDLKNIPEFLLNDHYLGSRVRAKSFEMMPIIRDSSFLHEKLQKATRAIENAACKKEDRLSFQNSTKIPPFDCNESPRSNKSDAEIADSITQHIQTEEPVGIIYCSKVLFRKTYLKHQMEKKAYPPPPEDDRWIGPPPILVYKKAHPGCDWHVSVVIGTRTCEDGRKEFLVRNSWGTGEGIRPNMRSDIEWDNGNHWVDANLLSKNIGHLSVIQGSPQNSRQESKQKY